KRPTKNRSREFLDAANFGKRKCDFPSAISYSTLASQIRAQRSEVRSPISKLMFATIYLPNFYLQAAIRHHPKLRAQPVALIDASQKKVAIIELNDAAEKAGIASSPETSYLAAHLARPVLQIDQAKEFLAPLPIETLAIA